MSPDTHALYVSGLHHPHWHLYTSLVHCCSIFKVFNTHHSPLTDLQSLNAGHFCQSLLGALINLHTSDTMLLCHFSLCLVILFIVSIFPFQSLEGIKAMVGSLVIYCLNFSIKFKSCLKITYYAKPSI